MLINFTNHPSDKWSETQRAAAIRYGGVTDIPFPQIEPGTDTDSVARLAAEYAERILSASPSAVLCQGEMTTAFAVTVLLQRQGIPVLAAESKRLVNECVLADGSTEKSVRFVFCGFREYPRV